MKKDLRKILMGYRDRCKALHALTATGTFDGLDAVFDASLNQTEQQKIDEAKRVGDLMESARGGNRAAQQELCELRMENIDLYIRASSNFASMQFETVTLKDNEQFCVEHTFRNPVAVRYIAQDGGARSVKAVKAQKQTIIDVRELHTDDVTYPMRDIQQGNSIAAASAATVDLSWDLANKMDVECFNLLQGGVINGLNYGAGVYGNFRTTGARLDRTYIPHPRINTDNLPTTNDLVLADNGTSPGQSNLFRLKVIRAIIAYCDAWANVFGEPIRPTGAIFIPSSETTGLAEEIVPTGTFYNQVAEGVLQKYTRFSYMDVNWTLIPDVTLPKGMCYPVLSRPVGKILVKPSFDMEYVESFPKKNLESRSASKVAGFCFFEPNRVNALRVKYSSTYTALTSNE